MHVFMVENSRKFCKVDRKSNGELTPSVTYFKTRWKIMCLFWGSLLIVRGIILRKSLLF